MKKPLLLSFLLLVTVVVAPAVKGQDCGLYYDLRKGGVYELTAYDNHDQLTGRIMQEVRQAKTSKGKTTAVIHQQVTDKKGKAGSSSDYTVECEAGVVRLDMRTMLSPQMTLGSPQNTMQAEVTGDFLELPAVLKPGTQLKNGSMTAVLRDEKSGVAISTTTINISNRHVESTETIKTAAGSFACTKVVQDMQVKVGIGGLAIPVNMRTADWYAPGVGVVRSETYRKDKLMSYTLLTALPK
ncbi:hypothetical protein [Hymenobacter sp.]|jgi:hypothetical protein|uniref:TapB family protein n=1 Tax=Hymenobacter sp. TaxID=1898978 RepID=UPI002ED94218